jgi:hypothetical protein
LKSLLGKCVGTGKTHTGVLSLVLFIPWSQPRLCLIATEFTTSTGHSQGMDS